MALQTSLRRASARLAGSSTACYAQSRSAATLKLPELPYDYRYAKHMPPSPPHFVQCRFAVSRDLAYSHRFLGLLSAKLQHAY